MAKIVFHVGNIIQPQVWQRLASLILYYCTSYQDFPQQAKLLAPNDIDHTNLIVKTDRPTNGERLLSIDVKSHHRHVVALCAFSCQGNYEIVSELGQKSNGACPGLERACQRELEKGESNVFAGYNVFHVGLLGCISASHRADGMVRSTRNHVDFGDSKAVGKFNSD